MKGELRLIGGNALGNTVRRFDKEEFEELAVRLYLKLPYLGIKKFNVIPYYRNKQSFGDIDILCENIEQRDILKKKIIYECNTKSIHINSNVVSFEYKQLQVDLIFMPEKYYNSSLFYYSYNDLNNLTGRIAHKFGVKFGHRGLEYMFRTDHGNVSKDVLLTQDPKKIYDFLDYDYDRYSKGFEELEDIFEFVVNSKYFSSEVFQLEYLNHENRTRNRKRKTYQRFLEWLNSREPIKYEYHKDKDKYLPLIDEHFPEIKIFDQIKLFKEEEAIRKNISKKFNGKIIMSLLSELKGSKLGKFICDFKNQHKDFNNYILTTSDKQIKNDIIKFYEKIL